MYLSALIWARCLLKRNVLTEFSDKAISYQPKCATCQAAYIKHVMVNIYNGYNRNDLQPGYLADRLLTGLGQPQINP